MARSFWQSILTWFAGCAIGVILTSIIFKIGWDSKEHILILGYGGLTSIVVFYVKFTSQIKKKELDLIESKFKEKADSIEVEKVQVQINSMHQTLNFMVTEQQKVSSKMDNIYDLLLNKKL
jgi:uncharacterized coiled-coil protein SlyX